MKIKKSQIKKYKNLKPVMVQINMSVKVYG